MMASEKVDPSKFVAEVSADGVVTEIPVIAYTEQVLAEKEAVLRKYIEDNYARIHSIEKELSSLSLEVKLTSGAKKAGLEMLRKKIEQSTERVREAKRKEEQAKKLWEAAAKVVADEEAAKQKLCDDLKLMVQENAMQQYERLEALTQKLDALNPTMAGAAKEVLDDLRAKIAPHGAPLFPTNGTAGGVAATATSPSTGAQPAKPSASQWATHIQQQLPEGEAQSGAPGAEFTMNSATSPSTAAAAQSPMDASDPKSGSKAPKLSKGGGKGSLSKGKKGAAAKGATGSLSLQGKGYDGSGWTGAGFDVDAT